MYTSDHKIFNFKSTSATGKDYKAETGNYKISFDLCSEVEVIDRCNNTKTNTSIATYASMVDA